MPTAGDDIYAPKRMGVRLRRAANQSINSGSVTTVSWDTEDQDTDAMWAIGTPTVVTIPSGGSGLWAITATAAIATGSSGTRNFIYIDTNTTINGVPGTLLDNSGAGEDNMTISCVVPLDAGDTFTVSVHQNAGSSRNITATLNAYLIGV